MLNSRTARFMLAPGVLLLIATLLGPLVTTLVFSLGARAPNGGYEPALSITNFIDISTRAGAFLNTIKLAALGAAMCVLVGMPVAYFIAKRLTGSWRFTMLFLVVLPFFTSFVARTYAWYFILGGKGLPALIDWAGLGRYRLLNTDFAVFVGVVYAYLPIMILTLFIAFDRIGNELIEASHDLGRGKIETWLSVVLPLALPGIISGYTLVFVLLCGEYLIPMLLGGGKVYFVGNAIVDLFLQSRNWPLGSAIAIALILMLTIAAIASRAAQNATGGADRTR